MLVHTSRMARTSPGRGIALFDHLQNSAVAVLRGGPQHPPVAGRVVEHRGDRRRRVAAAEVGGDELLEGLGAQQRRIAGEHDDGRVVVEVVARDGRHPDHRRVTRAALHRLLDEGDVRPARRLLLHLLGHPLGTVADHHDGAVDVDVGQGVDDVHDHRAATDQVQRLGSSGAHSRALAGRQHDRRNCHATVLARRGAEVV